MVEFTRGVYTVAGGADAAAANNIDNYRLFDIGGGAETDCSHPGDIALSDLISYHAASKQAVISLSGSKTLPEGRYRLVVCGTIKAYDNIILSGAGRDRK